MVRSLGLITVAILLAITTPARAIEFQAPAQQIKTGSYPEALAHADVTGDGAQELLVVTSFSFDAANDGKLIVYTPHPTLGFVESKRFSTHSTSNAARGLAAGDFDGDGDADVAVGLPNGIDHLVQSDAGLADPVLLAGSPTAIARLIAAQLDEDAADELLVLHDRTVSRGDLGAEGWAWKSYGSPGMVRDIAVGDLEGDGITDVVGVGQDLWRLPVLPEGQGWSGLQTGLGADGVAIGDLTGDGLPDVAVSIGRNSPEARILVYRGSGSGVTSPPDTHLVHDIPEPLLVADMNGDERADLVTAHGGWNAFGLLLQKADGRLEAERRWAIPYASHYPNDGLVAMDVDGDGRRDVVIADYNHGLVVSRQLAPKVTPDAEPPAAPSPPPAASSAPPPAAAPAVPAAPEPARPPRMLRARHLGGLKVEVRCASRCRVVAGGSLRRGSRRVAQLAAVSKSVRAGGRAVLRMRPIDRPRQRRKLRLHVRVTALDHADRSYVVVVRDRVKRL